MRNRDSSFAARRITVPINPMELGFLSAELVFAKSLGRLSNRGSRKGSGGCGSGVARLSILQVIEDLGGIYMDAIEQLRPHTARRSALIIATTRIRAHRPYLFVVRVQIGQTRSRMARGSVEPSVPGAP
jgi:hypothetical protein